jgi:hypothetical protein
MPRLKHTRWSIEQKENCDLARADDAERGRKVWLLRAITLAFYLWECELRGATFPAGNNNLLPRLSGRSWQAFFSLSQHWHKSNLLDGFHRREQVDYVSQSRRFL